MAEARSWFHSLVLAAGCGLALTTACEQRTAAPAPEAVLPARPTTVGDSRSLMRALKPRMTQSLGGLRVEDDGHGNMIIRHKGVLQNVMVAGRGADGGVVTGCVSSPEQVPAVMGGEQNPGR